MSDPSYAGQIVTLTYPQVGNYGVSAAAMQSGGLALSGLVVRDMCREPSNWQSEGSLPDLLRKSGVVAIEGVDTRAHAAHSLGGRHARRDISRAWTPGALWRACARRPGYRATTMYRTFRPSRSTVVPAAGKPSLPRGGVRLRRKAHRGRARGRGVRDGRGGAVRA